MTVYRYTDKAQQVFGTNAKPEPWLHCAILDFDKKRYLVIWVWDSRKIVAIEPLKIGDAELHLQKANDSHMPLTNCPSNARLNINAIFGFLDVQAEQQIRQTLTTGDFKHKAIANLKALIRIYECNNAKEREKRRNFSFDGVGFSHRDMTWASVVAEKLLRHQMPDKEQIWHAINAMPKYAKQLTYLRTTKSAIADNVEQWLKQTIN